MVSYLIKISLRRIVREKGYAFVNIIGLALGMGSALIIFLFLKFETSYDNYHPDHESIYRVGTELNIIDHNQGYAVSSAAVAPAMAEYSPQIVSYLRIFPLNYFLHDIIFYHDGKSFIEQELFAVDSTMFEFFHHEFISGTATTALAKPFSIVFTRSLAEEIFGHTNITGQKLKLSDAGVFTITAVIENPPLNSQFQFRALISMSSLSEMPDLFDYAFGRGLTWETFEKAFGSTIVWSYIKVNEDFVPQEFIEKQWPEFSQEYISRVITDDNWSMTPIFHPLASVHLDSDLLYELSEERDMMRLMNRQMVIVFFVIALFLLMLAAINYTNISISHFNKRRKEMAMVKILGSKASQLFAAFFAESFITSLISLSVSLVLVELIINPINQFLFADLSLNITSDMSLVLLLIAIFLFTAILSGLFPALYFVYTPPVKLLATRFNPGKKTLYLKKLLVVVQFTIAVFMISSAFVVYRQFNFMQDFNLGYNVQNITAIEVHSRHNKQNMHVLDSLLNNYPEVEVTARSNYLFSMNPIKHTALFETDRGYSTVRSFNNIQTSGEYMKLMGIKVYDDKSEIDPDSILTGDGVLVNRVLADSLKFIHTVGKSIVTHYQFLEGRQRRTRVIKGIVGDFHYALLNRPVEPLVILPLPNERSRYLVVKFNTDDEEVKESILNEAWLNFDQRNPLSYSHLSDNVDGFFSYNRNLSVFFSYFAWLCVILSFLGVLGITALNIEQRSAEIGIRKVLGASWYDFFGMFFNSYFLLYIIGSVAGIIASYLLVERWLNSFAFRISPGIQPFLMAVFLVGFTVWIAIIIHIIRIMYLNPAEAIRKE